MSKFDFLLDQTWVEDNELLDQFELPRNTALHRSSTCAGISSSGEIVAIACGRIGEIEELSAEDKEKLHKLGGKPPAAAQTESAPVVLQEPFGYFKAEHFGWRNCAEAEEGAIALYEAPQPQADARDAERYLDYLIHNQARVCNNLDEYEGDEDCADCGYWLEFTDSNSQRWVQIGVFKNPRDAIDAAIAAAKEMK